MISLTIKPENSTMPESPITKLPTVLEYKNLDNLISSLHISEINETNLLEKVKLLEQANKNYFWNLLQDCEKFETVEDVLECYQTNPTNPALQKFTLKSQQNFTSNISKNLQKLISSQLTNPGSNIRKSTLYYLKGKILQSCTLDHSPSAENSLQKAVKLDPTLANAWNELAECYWRRGQINQCKSCLDNAEKHGKGENITTLITMSTLLRQMRYENDKERCNAIMKSVKLAKLAIKIDMNNGEPWYNLGNAYVSMMAAGLADVKQANVAFEKAKMVDKNAIFNPDLHFNQAQLYLFLGEFQKMLNGLKFAKMLIPDWVDAQRKINLIENYLLKIDNQIKTKGKLKNKKLKTFVDKLKDSNPNSGIVIASIDADGTDILAFTAVVMKKDQNFQVLRISNLLQGGNILIGNVLEYAKEIEPKIVKIKNVSNRIVSFEMVSIKNPDKELLINGKRVDPKFNGSFSISSKGNTK